MNISEQIIDVIDVLCEKFGIAIDWTAETILPYVEQLCVKFINFEIWTSVFWIVFWIFLAGITWLIFLPCKKTAEHDNWDFDYLSPWVAAIEVFKRLSNGWTLLSLFFICKKLNFLV